jgi:hypothetical protein
LILLGFRPSRPKKPAEPTTGPEDDQERTAVLRLLDLSDWLKSLQEVRFAAIVPLTTEKPFAILTTSRNTKGQSP